MKVIQLPVGSGEEHLSRYHFHGSGYNEDHGRFISKFNKKILVSIQNFAQKLVNADRASLFLLDSKTKELYARIFDVGTNADEHQKMNENGTKDLRLSGS